MKEQTKVTKWLPWAISATAVLLLCLLAFNFNWWWFPVGPWTEAAGLNTILAINEFQQGVNDLAPHWEPRIKSLVSLILIFIVGPSLWVYGEVRNEKDADEAGKDHLKRGLSWYLGSALICAGLFLALPVPVIKGMVYNNTIESVEAQKNLDELRGSLTEMGYEAFEWYYLPAERGGGNGSFYLSEGGNKQPIQLSDLKSYNEDSMNSFYLSDEITDSTITIYGVGYADSEDPDFQNINNETGKVQVSIAIKPSGLNQYRYQYFELHTDAE